MQKIKEKVKPGWAIPTDVKDSFVEFCARVGAVAQEDCAGALFLWQHMPPSLREWAKMEAKDSSVKDEQFWKSLGIIINEIIYRITVSSSPEQKYAVLEGLGERVVADVTQKDKKEDRKGPEAG